MARSYGKLLASVWVDPDWTRLKAREQWLYMLLLSQPKLTLVGSLDYHPARIALLSCDIDADRVDATVDGLEASRFVAVDRSTGELLIRSFTRHDGIATANYKLKKGMWAAWMGIASPYLRDVAVANMPAELFDDDAPEAAVSLRWSQAQERANERSIDRSNGRATEPPEAMSLQPEAAAETDARSDHRLPDEVIEQGYGGLAAARAAMQQGRN